MEYKRNIDSKGSVPHLPIDMLHGLVNRTKKMAEIKFGLILAYIIGVPLWIFAYVPNFDSWKGNVLFIIMATYWTGMIIFNFRRKIRLEAKEKSEQRLRDIEAWHKEQDKIDRMNSNKKKTE